MSELDSIRASDAERDVAATRLQAAFAEGRIDDDEFDLRMRAALTARTGPPPEQDRRQSRAPRKLSRPREPG